MKGFLGSAVFPLLLLAVLLFFGTREGTEWERNLIEPGAAVGIDERFSSFSPDESALVKEYRGIWGRHGLLLGPGERGFATFVLPMAPGADSLTLRIWAYDYGSCSVKWWPAEQPCSPLILSDGGNLSGKSYRIERSSPANQVIIEISGRNDTSQAQVLVDRIAVNSSSLNPVRGWPLAFWLWGAATALWLTAAMKRKWWTPPGGIKLWYAALALIIIGGTLRLSLLSAHNGVPLDPDVVMYLNYAERLEWFDSERGFYSASFSEREPLWVAMLKIWQGWVGKGDLSARFLTCFLSASVIGLSGILLWRFLEKSHWVVAGMGLVALNASLVEESCRGLRSEAMTVAFICFLLLTFPKKESRFMPVKAGIIGGAWALLQSPALSVVSGTWLGLWLLSLFVKKIHIRPWIPTSITFTKVLLVIGVSAALFVPHLHGLQKRHGDWRWPSYGYARWNANVEFPDRLGTSGFPTIDEFKKSPYAGPKISYAEYLFGLHTPFELAKYQAMGWVELTAYQALSLSPQSHRLAIEMSSGRFSGIISPFSPALILGFSLGIIALVAWFRLPVDKQLWWMPLMLLLGTFYVAFLYHVRLVEPFRHTMHTYPLVVLIMMWGVQWLWNRSRILELVRHVWTRRLYKQQKV